MSNSLVEGRDGSETRISRGWRNNNSDRRCQSTPGKRDGAARMRRHVRAERIRARCARSRCVGSGGRTNAALAAVCASRPITTLSRLGFSSIMQVKSLTLPVRASGAMEIQLAHPPPSRSNRTPTMSLYFLNLLPWKRQRFHIQLNSTLGDRKLHRKLRRFSLFRCPISDHLRQRYLSPIN